MRILIISWVAVLGISAASGSPIPAIILGCFTPLIVRHIKMKKYFASPEFQEHKDAVESLVDEFNEVSKYVDEIRGQRSFDIGRSSTGAQAHLASFVNTSHYAYRRDRNQADYASANVHNASLQVVRNASADPIKYLVKYFGIEATEEKLAVVESVGESISRLESAISNLTAREASIAESVAPPEFILKHYLKIFREKIGITIPELSVPYPVYTFQYVSAGGNSSQVARIRLDSQTIDYLIEYLSTKIKWKNSAAAARALMTAKLRNYIKTRDNFTCQDSECNNSIYNEPNLLLEVDHRIPVSRGGQSVEENLQTLCWKCNRTKSNKLV